MTYSKAHRHEPIGVHIPFLSPETVCIQAGFVSLRHETDIN